MKITDAVAPLLPPKVQDKIQTGEGALGLGLTVADRLGIGTIRKKEV